MSFDNLIILVSKVKGTEIFDHAKKREDATSCGFTIIMFFTFNLRGAGCRRPMHIASQPTRCVASAPSHSNALCISKSKKFPRLRSYDKCVHLLYLRMLLVTPPKRFIISVFWDKTYELSLTIVFYIIRPRYGGNMTRRSSEPIERCHQKTTLIERPVDVIHMNVVSFRPL